MSEGITMYLNVNTDELDEYLEKLEQVNRLINELNNKEINIEITHSYDSNAKTNH